MVHREQLAGVSARTSRRIRFSQRKAQDVDRVIQGVNSLYTGRPGPPPPPGLLSRPKLSLAQESILSHIQSSVEALGPPPADLTHEGALQKLRVARDYDLSSSGDSALVSYDLRRRVLADWGDSSRGSLSVLLGTGGQHQVT